jgi:hypothetical protein
MEWLKCLLNNSGTHIYSMLLYTLVLSSIDSYPFDVRTV